MKEIKFTCPRCGLELIEDESDDTDQYFLCTHCQLKFNIFKLICPICMQKFKKLTLPYSEGQYNKPIRYCNNCLSTDDFYICPYQRSMKCLKYERVRCVGVGIKDRNGEICNLNPNCEVDFLSIDNFLFTKHGIELNDKQILRVFRFILNHRRWPNNLKITTRYDILS